MKMVTKDYTQWDYSNGWLPEDTKMGMYYLFQEGDTKKIIDFLTWLKEENSQFMFNHKDFIFTRLVEFKHFSITDTLCTTKPYQFDEKIAKTCAGNLSLTFDCESFDYWKKSVDKLEPSQQSTVIRKFWSEFLTYQFIRAEEFDEHLPNLKYVFEKIPFYLDLERELSNGYFIKERADFLNDKTSRLKPHQQHTLLSQLGFLCATYHLEAKDLFMEEFANYPVAIDAFNTVLLHKTLEETLDVKKNSSKMKI